MVKAFIDSNVIANWIMIDGRYMDINKIEDENKKQAELTKFKEEIKKYPYQKASYDFLEKFREDTFGHLFFVSELVFNEVLSVILEEYVARKLISQKIPIRFWSKRWNTYKKRTRLSNRDGRDIVDGKNHFTHTFLDTDLIKRAKEEYDEQTIVDLIITYKQDTHDSSIVAIAVANKCEYLITEDKRLRKELKDKKFERIKLIASDTFKLEFLN